MKAHVYSLSMYTIDQLSAEDANKYIVHLKISYSSQERIIY